MRKLTLATVFVALGLLGGVAVFGQRANEPARSGLTPLPPTSPLDVIPPAASNFDDGDPMRDVDVFMEDSRRRADASIARLTKEAERLRSRLRTVESALERWKSVATALERKPGGASPRRLPPVEQLPPTEPGPVPIERAPNEPGLELPASPSLPEAPR